MSNRRPLLLYDAGTNKAHRTHSEGTHHVSKFILFSFNPIPLGIFEPLRSARGKRFPESGQNEWDQEINLYIGHEGAVHLNRSTSCTFGANRPDRHARWQAGGGSGGGNIAGGNVAATCYYREEWAPR